MEYNKLEERLNQYILLYEIVCQSCVKQNYVAVHVLKKTLWEKKKSFNCVFSPLCPLVNVTFLAFLFLEHGK